MKRISRFIVLILTLSMVTTMFSGCKTEESALLDAILKTYNATSMEAKTTMAVNFDVTGDSKSQYPSPLDMLKAVKYINISANQKAKRSTDDTMLNTQMDLNYNLGGISTNLSVWIDANMDEKSPKFNEIIKIPPIATMAFPSKYRGREFVTLDYSTFTMENAGLESFNPMYITKNLTNDLTAFLKVYSKQFDPGFDYVETKENVVVNGETLNAYTLKFSDKTAKEFARYLMNNFLDNKDAIGFLKNRAQLIMSQKMSTEEFNRAFEEFEAAIPKMKESMNKYFDSIDGIKIFGEKGINIDFLVNKEGYIVKQKGSISFNINQKDLAFVDGPMSSMSVNSSAPEGQGLKVDFSFETDISNINKEIIIETPVITADNSMNINDMIKEQKAEAERMRLEYEEQEDRRNAAEGIIGIKMNNSRVYFAESPKVIDGRLMAPIKPILSNMNAQLQWDPKTASVTCNKGDKTIVLKIGSKDVVVNGEKKTLDVAPRIINGFTYLPVRVITELFDGEIQWNSETKVANIIYTEK